MTTNYIIKKGNDKRTVTQEEFSKEFSRLRKLEKERNEFLFWFIVDYNDEYIVMRS